MLQPLLPEQVERSVAAALTPEARLVLSLTAVHAARVAQITALTLDDIDLGNRRPTIAGRGRPLDNLTLQLLTHWLDHRRCRWPSTANLHLLINNQTANTTSWASNHWIRAPLRGQDAALERLHVHRQLEEALTHGPDPLHLAEAFGLDENTAMRYADSARALLEQAAEQTFDEICSTRTHRQESWTSDVDRSSSNRSKGPCRPLEHGGNPRERGRQCRL